MKFKPLLIFVGVLFSTNYIIAQRQMVNILEEFQNENYSTRDYIQFLLDIKKCNERNFILRLKHIKEVTNDEIVLECFSDKSGKIDSIVNTKRNLGYKLEYTSNELSKLTFYYKDYSDC